MSPVLQIMDQSLLRGKDIHGIADLSQEELSLILETAELLKEHIDDDAQMLLCKGQSLAMLFEKPSLRTRVTFELGMKQLGGHAIFLEGPLGIRESVADVAANLDRWVDGIMARTFSHSTCIELAQNAEIPVINGLSDLEHPCQALADLLTIKEHLGQIAGKKIAYIGDPNNVSNSLFLAAVKFGADCVLACPPQYKPESGFWELCQLEAIKSGGKVTLTHDPVEAAAGADVIYTDTWVSMGQEAEAEVKEKIFAPYQVDSTLVQHAAEDAIVMHCLPAHRGVEITAEVLDGPQSVIFDQSENRLHVQKAILSLVL
jgi:ornithine carbamoyltransferase